MDWLVEVTSERYYGPTTLGAVQEFFGWAKSTRKLFVINSCDGSRRQIREMTDLLPIAREDKSLRHKRNSGLPPNPPRPDGRSICRTASANWSKVWSKSGAPYQELEAQYQRTGSHRDGLPEQ